MNKKMETRIVNLTKHVKTEDELLLLTRQYGIDLTEAQQHALFKRLQKCTSHMAKVELDNVFGVSMLDDEMISLFNEIE